MKRLLKSVVAVLLSVSMLFGCSGKSGSDTKGDTSITGSITFWTQDTVSWQQYFGEALERFRAAYPNIEVKEEYFSSFADKINQSFDANTEADVIFTWQSVASWANAGKVLEVPDTVYSTADMEKNFYPGAIANKKYNDKYYCVSNEINVESPSLYVNMDKLAELGVELPEGWVENNGPSSWEDLYKFAKSLTVKDGTGVVTQAGLSYCYAQWEAMFESLIWQYGGEFRDEANKTVHFETSEAKKALEFMLKYEGTGADALCSGLNSRYDEFIEGTAVMCVGAPWYAGSFAVDIPDTNYQVFNMPAFVEGADPVSLATGGWGYTVSSVCKDTEAAWTFVKFMTSADEDGQWALTTGALPSRVDALADLSYDKDKGSVEKAIAISKDVLQYAQEDGAYMMTPSDLTYSIVREAIYQLMTDGDVDACLKTIQSGAETMLSENFSH